MNQSKTRSDGIQSMTDASDHGGLPATYVIGGVQVRFPVKPYPSQLAVMNKLISALKTKQSGLIESPTGSGKSIALICGALAWQEYESARLLSSPEDNGHVDKKAATSHLEPCHGKKLQDFINLSKQYDTGTSSDSDFIPYVPPAKRRAMSLAAKELVVAGTASSSLPHVPHAQQIAKHRENTLELERSTRPEQDKGINSRVPKIFYCTRTHKQISQVVQELKRTAYYAKTRFVILSSRAHSCINPSVMAMRDRNEGCRQLLESDTAKGHGCEFFALATRIPSQNKLDSLPVDDIEDFVRVARQAKRCPYYTAIHLVPTMQIVFCPYNYVLDPSIRRSMSIDLQDSVVLFDEGHNIEDAARNVLTTSWSQLNIHSAITDCDRVAGMIEGDPHKILAQMLLAMSGWIERESQHLHDGCREMCAGGSKLVESLRLAGFGQEVCSTYEMSYRHVLAARQRYIASRKMGCGQGFSKVECISHETIVICDKIFQMLGLTNINQARYQDDFRLSMSKEEGMTHVTLTLWCLNPGVVMQARRKLEDLESISRCVVLVSGTLAPLQPLESELGIRFPIRLEAKHVVDKGQIWAGAVSCGPSSKVSLDGSYLTSSHTDYQDEIGQVIKRVCSTVQHGGVLCFLPSYRQLKLLTNRWKETGMWDAISNMKKIFVEPTAGDFNQFLKTYHESVANASGTGSVGCILFAVYRGKASEGLNFADNSCRALVCIGIPFPNSTDLKVQQKKLYNDQRVHGGHLSGSQWYTVQAFRALNQALGRCIRHRDDWGAILLVDSRYHHNPAYVELLPKWFRTEVVMYQSWDGCIASLSAFNTLNTCGSVGQIQL